MATQPGPRQVFPANITRVSFPTVGGLVFFRVAQKQIGPGATPDVAPKALVTGLPWGPFDMFELAGQNKVDDKSKLGGVAITNPVTPKMLDKYLYWPHRNKVHSSVTSVIPGSNKGVFTVDVANWSPAIKGNIAFRITPLMEREAARQLYIDIYTTEGLIPALASPDDITVVIISNTGRLLTEDEIIAIAPSAGWIYHYEPSTEPPATTKNTQDVALVVLNLQKLYRDMPLVGGKKPTTFKFKVRAPANTTHDFNTTLTWDLTASAWIPKSSTPPKAKERLTFPVEDGPDLFMSPTFPHPDDNATASEGRSNGEEENEVTITFGVAGVPPKVTLTPGNGGGVSGGTEG